MRVSDRATIQETVARVVKNIPADPERDLRIIEACTQLVVEAVEAANLGGTGAAVQILRDY